MKRTIAIILIMMIIGIQTTIYAADPSYSIGLVPSKTDVALGEEVEIILKVKDFENVTSGLYGYSAFIEYDKNVFEELPVDPDDHISENLIGEEQWDYPVFNQENGKIVATTSKGVKAESNVLKIKLKVKSNAVIGAKPQIKITNFEASDANNIIKAKADAVVSLNVVEKTNDTPNSNPDNNGGASGSGTGTSNPSSNNGGASGSGTSTNNPNGSNGGASGTGTSNPSSNNGGAGSTGTSNPSSSNSANKTPNTVTPNKAQNSNTNDISNKKLPQTGEADWIYVAAISVIIIGAVSYIKYKRTY